MIRHFLIFLVIQGGTWPIQAKSTIIYCNLKQHIQHPKFYIKASLVLVNVKYAYDKKYYQIINVQKS